MKFIALLTVLMSFNTFAKEYYTKTINWDARYLEDSTVLQCDDTYVSGVIVEIPGEYKYPESSISFKDCGSDWKLTKKKMIKRYGKPFTSVQFDGNSPCIIEVHGKKEAAKKVFTLEIHDAC